MRLPDVSPEELERLGLGLRRGVVRLARAQPAWSVAAQQLIDDLAGALDGQVGDIEHIGSTAVAGLLAKPILDIAVRLRATAEPRDVVEVLRSAGWEYRGDAGSTGGLVFVLNVRPDHRVAHAHVVGAADRQWEDYLVVRDRLRSDPAARAAYEDVKRRLADAYPTDRVAYTDGKDAIVAWLKAPSSARTVYEAVGGADALLALARAWHAG